MLGLLRLWTFSVFSYCQQNITFRKLNLFAFSRQKAGSSVQLGLLDRSNFNHWQQRDGFFNRPIRASVFSTFHMGMASERFAGTLCGDTAGRVEKSSNAECDILSSVPSRKRLVISAYSLNGGKANLGLVFFCAGRLYFRNMGFHHCIRSWIQPKEHLLEFAFWLPCIFYTVKIAQQIRTLFTIMCLYQCHPYMFRWSSHRHQGHQTSLAPFCI
jgi:hypothetical protein